MTGGFYPGPGPDSSRITAREWAALGAVAACAAQAAREIAAGIEALMEKTNDA